jgi:hypothetical protein
MMQQRNYYLACLLQRAILIRGGEPLGGLLDVGFEQGGNILAVQYLA